MKILKILLLIDKKNSKSYDLAIIANNHDKYDYNFLKKNFRYIFDDRGVF